MVSRSTLFGFLLLFSMASLHAHNMVQGNREGKGPSVKQHNIIPLPEIEILKTIKESRTRFTGTFHSEYSAAVHDNKEPMSLEEEQEFLSWEIAWPHSGKRVQQIVNVHAKTKESAERANEEQGKNKAQRKPPHRRGKRNVYDIDTRYYIPLRKYARLFPFASVVKTSSGCTGTLVSPRHVLTAAHCIHDQTDYIKEYKDLKVGFIQPTRRWEQSRATFRWAKVVNSYLPGGWKIGIPDIAANFDYCLLKLESAHHKPFFQLGISENTTNGRGERIHFTAFEDDKPSDTMWYRYCEVTDADDHILYHYCDAKPGSSGSGVYLWDYDADDKEWARKLIGVFSGTRSKEYNVEPGQIIGNTRHTSRTTINVNFNAAIRINAAKYTQICKWMGDYSTKSCKKKYYIN